MSEGYKSITGLTDIPATAGASAAGGIQTCAVCANPFFTAGGQGHYIRERWVCDPCLQTAKLKAAGGNVAAVGTSDGDFTTSVLFGVGAAVLGLAIYAGFTIVTHFYLGYVALAVGWLIAKAMMAGSKGVGGMRYQVTAVVLTYLAISLAAVPILIAAYSQRADGTQVDWMSHAGQLAIYGLFSPFLRLRGGISHVIGLVILFVGLRIAWRMAAGTK